MIYLNIIALIGSLFMVISVLVSEWQMSSNNKSDKLIMALLWGGVVLGSLSDIFSYFSAQ